MSGVRAAGSIAGWAQTKSSASRRSGDGVGIQPVEPVERIRAVRSAGLARAARPHRDRPRRGSVPSRPGEVVERSGAPVGRRFQTSRWRLRATVKPPSRVARHAGSRARTSAPARRPPPSASSAAQRQVAVPCRRAAPRAARTRYGRPVRASAATCRAAGPVGSPAGPGRRVGRLTGCRADRRPGHAFGRQAPPW